MLADLPAVINLETTSYFFFPRHGTSGVMGKQWKLPVIKELF